MTKWGMAASGKIDPAGVTYPTLRYKWRLDLITLALRGLSVTSRPEMG